MEAPGATVRAHRPLRLTAGRRRSRSALICRVASPGCQAGSMSFERAWDGGLLRSLSTWAVVREVEGAIEVTFVAPSGARRTVELVMRPEEWEELSEVIGAETPSTVKGRILALDEDQPFLVCDSGVELLASSSREVPPDDDFMPDAGGQWVVTDDAGNVVSRFAEWRDDEH